MKRQVLLMAIVLGVSAFAVACGDGGTQSVLGPSSAASGTARSGSGGGGADDGVTGGVDDGAAAGGSAALQIGCELRSGRSKVSVDARNVTSGTYQARITSGANSATAAARASIGDEVEFDFDSDPDDVAAGATSIAGTFIQNGTVRGELLNASGAVVLSANASCSVR